jgi:hypothetical protein
VSGSFGEEVVMLQERGVPFDGLVVEDRHVKIANFRPGSQSVVSDHLARQSDERPD